MDRILLLILLLCLSACQSSHARYSSNSPDPSKNDLAMLAMSLEGTPYRYGGSSPDTGFDCSGFVGYVYKQSMGLKLPRSSYDMSDIGKKVDEDDLQPGDLVFFNTMNHRYSHVGIYVGEGRFIHAPSTGKSVMIVNMNDRYYRQRYNGARRVNP